jgi:hypothetical protein
MVAGCGLGLAGAGIAASPELAVSGVRAAKPAWTLSITSPGDDWINDLVPLANGEVMAVGFLNRDDDSKTKDWTALAARIAPGGKLVARNLYGEGGGVDAFWSMIEAKGGRRMFAGFSDRHGLGGLDAWVVLAEADGRPVGEGVFGGEGYDRFTDVTQAGDGFVFLGHSQPGGSDRRRAFLVKTDVNGQEQWHQLFEGPESWGGLYVEPSGDGGFVVAGGVSEGGANADMFVVRTDAEGQELWRQRIGTPDWDEINHGVVVRPDGTIVLVGYTHKAGTEANDLIAATLTKDGTLVRLERFGGSGDERARLPKLAEDGRIWIAAHTDSAGAGGSDALIVALDRDGSFMDTAILVGGKSNDIGTAILPMPGGRLMLAGYSETTKSGEDAFVVAIDPVPSKKPNPAFQRTVVTPVP